MLAALASLNSNGVNYAPKKEMYSCFSAIALIDGRLREAVTLRLYCGRSAGSSVIYCTLWASGSGFSVSGSGAAGGGGYHKASAAAARAITSAGFILTADDGAPVDIAGAGDSAIFAALEAVAACLGATGQVLISRN